MTNSAKGQHGVVLVQRCIVSHEVERCAALLAQLMSSGLRVRLCLDSVQHMVQDCTHSIGSMDPFVLTFSPVPWFVKFSGVINTRSLG